MTSKCIKIQSILKATMLLAVFILLFVNYTFATSYEEANVVIGKNSTEGDELYVDERNTTLDKLRTVMSPEDAMKAYTYTSEYRKGDKEKESALVELIAGYDEVNAVQIANYILNENYITYLTTYTIDQPTKTIVETPIKSIMSFNNEEMGRAAASFWENVKWLVPDDFSSKIHSIHFEKDKDKENLITIRESTSLIGMWDMNVDISIVDISNTEKLIDYIMYITVFYYCLKDDQIENFVTAKENYIYNDKVYRSDSYINKFYKKFWKGRRQETNTNQYSLYKREFLNEKASRTVYDDMAVSFVNYTRNGYMKRYLGFRADKTNFFDEYEFFRNLAKHFRVKLGINKI